MPLRCRARAGALSFGERRLEVVFAKLLEHLFSGLDAIRAFDGAEVLEAIDRDEGEEAKSGS